MLASPIDPRNQTSEVNDPACRASWDSPSSCEGWELTEVDIDEVVEWIRVNGRGRPHRLWQSCAISRTSSSSDFEASTQQLAPGTWPARATETETHTVTG